MRCSALHCLHILCYLSSCLHFENWKSRKFKCAKQQGVALNGMSIWREIKHQLPAITRISFLGHLVLKGFGKFHAWPSLGLDFWYVLLNFYCFLATQYLSVKSFDVETTRGWYPYVWIISVRVFMAKNVNNMASRSCLSNSKKTTSARYFKGMTNAKKNYEEFFYWHIICSK